MKYACAAGGSRRCINVLLLKLAFVRVYDGRGERRRGTKAYRWTGMVAWHGMGIQYST
jgi:hypothetical protein